jgi:hypothetical protein
VKSKSLIFGDHSKVLVMNILKERSNLSDVILTSKDFVGGRQKGIGTMVAAPIRLTASPSPITTETVALSGVSFADLQTYGDVLYFACRDPKNAGRACVKSIIEDGTETARTPLTANVRSAVHEYGGGAFTVGPTGVIYTDFPSHTMYLVAGPNDEPTLIYQDKRHRFADFSVTHTSPPMLLAIMEDHTDPKPSQVKNSIVTMSLDGKGTLTTLASGHDFYSSPQLQGDKLAYVAWDHPNMPWDNTMLYVQHVDGNVKPLGDAILACDEKASVAEPRWTPNGSLIFLSDHKGWYNLYRYNQQDKSIINLCPKEADFCSGGQGWILGLSPFTVMPNGVIVSAYTDEEEGGSKLVMIAPQEGSPAKVQEYGRLDSPCHHLALLAGSICSHFPTLFQVGDSPDFNFIILCYRFQWPVFCGRFDKGTACNLVLGKARY